MKPFFITLSALVQSIGLVLRNSSVRIRFFLMTIVAFVLVCLWILVSFEVAPKAITFLFEYFGFELGEDSWANVGVHWGLNVISIVFGLVITPFVVVIFAIPICTPLSNQVDEIMNPSAQCVTRQDWFRQWVLSLLLPTIMGLLGTSLLFCGSFLPFVGPLIGGFTIFVWAPMNLAFSLSEISLDRRGYSFLDKLKFVKANPLTTWSLGLQAQTLFSIPIVNFVGCPLAIMATTISVGKLADEGE